MADQRITQLTALPKAGVAATDVLPIADISASETKKVTVKDLVAAGIDLVDNGEIDLAKLDQASTTKLGATAIADGAITSAKLAADSSVAVQTTAPSTGNFEGRGYFNSDTGNLQVFNGTAYQQVVAPTAGIGDLQVTTGKLADGAVTTAKVTALSSAALADAAVVTAKIADANVTTAKLAAGAVTADEIGAGAVTNAKLDSAAVTYAKIQNVSATDRLLGRSSAGSGTVEEIPLTAAGRALIDDADAAAQRTTLGLGNLAVATGTWTNGSSFAGTSSGNNTGDQTITLTGDVTGTGTGTFAASIATGAVTEAKIASNAVSTGKIADDAVTAAKLADNSAVIVAADVPSGNGAFTGQQWINSNTGFEYTWTGSIWQRLHGISTINFSETTPLAFSASYPDPFSATLNISADTQAANRVWAGPTTGSDAAPTFRALQPADLPDATASTKGVIQPGTGLAVSSGALNHSNSVATGTYTKVTVDAQGHVSAGTTLEAADVPALDASKITTGSFAAAQIGSDAVTGAKLADYSTAQIGESLPVAEYIGQLFFNPLDKNIYLWDGNVWQPVGVSLGELIFAGTYDANLNEVLTTTTVGAAVGLVAGDPLPAASSTLTSYYVVVSIGGTGVAPAPTVALAPPDIILCDGSAWTEVDVSSTYVAQTAANVGFSPAGTIASTNVQGAIEEVATEAANATNLTSGTVAVARGGTNISSYTKGDLLAASAGTTLTKLGVGTNGQVLRANSATATGLEWGADFVGTVTSVSGSGAISVANGTTTPAITVAAATTSVVGVVQLSDSVGTTSSVLAATPTAVKSAYDLANAAMPKAGGTFTGDITLGATRTMIFEGATDDAFQTTLTVADPTADRTVTLPDATGTLVLSGAIVNADINASAAIAFSKLASLTSANILVGNGSNVATSVAVTGDVTISNAGVTAIASGVVVNADISATAAIALSKLATGALPTDITVASANIVDATIVNADISDTAAIAFSKLANVSATDRLLGRSSAGAGAIEEITCTAAGRALIDDADAAAQRTTLGLVIGTDVQGYDADTAKTDVTQSFTAAQRGAITALTDGATITPDFAVANNFSVTLGGNRTLANPSNLTAGQSGCIWITQDGTGSRTLAYGSQWDFTGGTAPTLTTTAASVDCLVYAVQSSTKITATLVTNLS